MLERDENITAATADSDEVVDATMTAADLTTESPTVSMTTSVWNMRDEITSTGMIDVGYHF